MHFRVGFLALLASLVPNALAGIQITSPTNSDRFKGGDTVLIEWKNDGKAPFLKDIGSFNIDLCIGSNDEIRSLSTLATGAQMRNSDSASFEVVVPSSIGEDGEAYFIQLVSAVSTGGTLTSYSPRFEMTGMTGEFDAAMKLIYENGIGQDVPEDKEDLPAKIEPGKGVVPPEANLFSVPYTKQTGATRYAPMQTQPGSVITATETKMQYPTSAFTIFKTIKGPPKHETTVTQPWNYKPKSKQNTAAPQPHPTADSKQKLLVRGIAGRRM